MLHLLESHSKILGYLLVQLLLVFFSRLVIAQFAEQLKIKDTSQLINGISNVFQKLPKYFTGTTISTSFILLLISGSKLITWKWKQNF